MSKRIELWFALVGFVGLMSFLFIWVGMEVARASVQFSKNEEPQFLENLGVRGNWSKDNIPSFEIKRANNTGKVIWVMSGNDKEKSSKCYLGAYYRIEKKALKNMNMRNLEYKIHEALSSEDIMFARAKEFSSFYLIYEPNKKICASKLNDIKQEVKKREVMWKMVNTVKTI